MAVVGKCAVHLRLIEAVREHEVLYNCDLKDYSDNILKMRLWRLIASKCDIASGDEAKKIWKNLRDGYRCSLKTLKIYEKKEPPRPLKPWKYVEEMEFLRPFMKDRIFTNVAYYEGYSVDFVEKRKVSDDSTMDSDLHVPSSISSFSGGDSTDLQEEIECRPDVNVLAQQELLNQLQQYDERDSTAQITNDLTTQAMSQLEALANIYQHPPGLHISMNATNESPKKRGRKRKGRVEMEPPPPLGAQMQSVPSTMERNQESNGDTEDSLKLFFDSMYATAKTLPMPLQRLIRIKLFQTVTDAEMAAESMAMEMLPHGYLQMKQDSPSE